MAEIKSTLQLALERSQRMAISQEEREEIKQKELLKKATGMGHRYMEGTLSLSELQREIERAEEKEAKRTKEILLQQWIGAISLHRDNDRMLRGIAVLKGKGVDDLGKQLLEILSEHPRRKKEAEEALTVRKREELKAEGISGSAVVPVFEGTREWKQMLEPLETSAQEKLEEVRAALGRL